MSAAAEVVGRTLTATSGGQIGMGILQVGLAAVQAGDVDEGLLVGAVAMSAAAEVVGRTLTATSGGQIGMGIIASGGGFAGVLQGAGLLGGVHLQALEYRPVEGLQLVGHVVERFQAVHASRPSSTAR